MIPLSIEPAASAPHGDPSAETAAVLVVYSVSADPTRLVAQLLSHLSHVVIVDNSPLGHPLVQQWCGEVRVTILANRNRGGLAGAYNVAVGWIHAHRPDIHFITFVDEDSDAQVLKAFLRDPQIIEKLSDPATAAVAPAHRERATGLRTRHLQLRRFGWTYLQREVRGVHRVAFLINSMSVWPVRALETIGLHNEWMGIDHVDTEYCLRARRMGLSVYLHGDYEFPQSIGKRVKYRIFGRELQSCGHSPQRRHSIGRTTAWLAIQYPLAEPAFSVLCLARLAYEVAGIVLAEPHRAAKLWAFGMGVCQGLVTRPPRVAGPDKH
jgi:rhamnosyltransferase